MTTHQQVEAVLRKHHIHPKSDGKQWWNEDFEELRDDLCALLTPPTQPDREALEALLRGWEVASHQHECLTPHDCCCATSPDNERLKLGMEIMAWATPSLLRREWCSHIYRRYSKTKLADRWFLKTNEQAGICAEVGVPDAWDTCPVTECHAPRPSQP